MCDFAHRVIVAVSTFLVVASDPRSAEKRRRRAMTKSNFKSVAGATTATVLIIAVSSNALAHGGGMGAHMGGSMGGYLGRTNATSFVGSNKMITRTTKLTHVGNHDRRRLHFLRFGYVGIDAAPVCFYKWTNLGRVHICPSLDY
jgi:hypothetical protein